MTISERCAVCKSPNRRRLVNLGWNSKMTAADISAGLSGEVGVSTILKHLKEHEDGGDIREIPVEEAKSVRSRVYAIQMLMVGEIERRVALAQEKAAIASELTGEPQDWADYFNILDKDMQAAVGSIIKTQAMKDKQETTTASLKIGLFQALVGAGKAPKDLIGALPALDDGMTVEGEARDLDD